MRVDEIAHLAWRDLRERGDAGQVTAYGKGGKTRVVLLPATVWRELVSIRDGAPADAPVFASRTKAGFLSTTQVRRLVYAAATAASLDERPSPPTPALAMPAHDCLGRDNGQIARASRRRIGERGSTPACPRAAGGHANGVESAG